MTERKLNTAIIPAAGLGARMHADRAKQMMELGGVPVIVHTLERFQQCDAIDQIIVVLQPSLTSEVLDKQEVKPEEFKAAKDKFREELLTDRRNRFFGAYMAKAKLRMKIEVNREMLQRAVG